MKNLCLIIVSLLLLSCNVLLKCPDERLVGEWSHRIDYGDNKYWSDNYQFRLVNNICVYGIRENKYFYVYAPESKTVAYYIWKIEGARIKLQECNENGISYDLYNWTELSFNYINNSSISIDNKIYTK